MHYRILIHLLKWVQFTTMFASFFCLLFLLQPLLLLAPGTVLSASGTATLLEINGPIGPAVGGYIQKGIERSESLDAQVIIIQLDTPGGLDHSMRLIIRAILASPVPVISYVAPDGARAASAGTYILYASHLAAMAPATNLGAASPVTIGGITEKKNQEETDNPEYEQKRSTLEKKIRNDASAYIKALAERHGRNAEWAVRAVEEAVSLSAVEAHEQGVINIVAKDLDDLLQQADGVMVEMEAGPFRVDSAGLRVVPIEQSWRIRLLAVISDPNIAYMLMLLGVYGLIYELANPGFVLPGVVGGICMLLALYAFQVLPVNYSGLALILLGIMLLVAEAYAPSFGSLGIGGIVAFSTGSLILMKDEELRVSLYVIVSTILLSSGLLIWLAGRLLSLRTAKVQTGMEAMIGMTGEAAVDFDQAGRVWILGESWQAVTENPVKMGEKVKITGTDGHVLIIEKNREVV